MHRISFFIQISISFFIIFLILSIGFAKIDGDSMKPYLNDKDIIMYKKNANSIKRFDIAILKINNQLLIKRVIGLPGEKISYIDNVLYVNGEKTVESFQKSITSDFSIDDIIPDNKILILGDNRLYSHDSRNFGLIDISNIKGTMLMNLFG